MMIPRIVVDTDVLTFFLEDSPVRTDFASVNERLTGAIPIYVSFIGDDEGTFREPESLRVLEAAAQRIERLSGVSEVLSSVDLVKLTNQAIEGGGIEHQRIPDTRAAVAETIFMLPKSRLRRFVNSNHSRANLVVRTGQSGSAAILDLESRIQEALAELDIPEDLRTEVTGNAILINRSADGIAGNQAAQVGLAAFAILLLVSWLFGSLRVGSLSMIPNILPVVVFFGILGAGVASLSVPTSLIGSIALGIAIDDTVHFLVSYQRLRATGAAASEAASHCILQVGRPIVMTTVMLVVGFLVMLLSGFATLREFGYLTAMTMAICLLSDMVLLPALLVRLRA
jgi:predicted RND superfamily exporter protein